MEKVIFFLLIVNPLLSVLFDSIFDYYRFISVIILVILVYKMFFKFKTMGYIITISTFILICFSININNMYSIGKYINHTVWFLNFILLIIYFSNEHNIRALLDYIKNKYKIIINMIIFINFIEFILIISKKGFVYHWEGVYFQGSNSMPHTCAYLMISILIVNLVLFEIKKEKKIILLSILPIVIIMLTGARSSLGILFILLVIFIRRNKLMILAGLSTLTILVLGRNIIIELPMVRKFLRQIQYGQFSSGRDKISEVQIDYFNNGTMINKIIGIGPDKTYFINLTYYGNEVWAHNDFIQILVGYGIIGVLVYVISILYFVICHLKRKNIFETILIICGVLFLAVTNGLYSYSSITLAMPIISVFLYTKNYDSKSKYN